MTASESGETRATTRVDGDAFRRLHPLTPFLGLLEQGPRAAVTLGILLLTTNFGRIAAVFAALLLVLQVLDYWRRTYCLTEEQLVIRSGWFQQSEQVVSPDRLQHVEVVRRVRHQVTGLARVELALAGSTKITLDSVSVDEAARIRETLERGRRRVTTATAGGVGQGGTAPGDVPPPPAFVLFELNLSTLALGALTGAGLLVLPAAAFGLINQFGEFAEGRVDADRLLRFGIPVLFLLAALATFVVAIGLMWIRHFGYTLSRSGGDLRVERGLLDRRSSVIPVRRVQRVELAANVLRRWVGLASIDATVAHALNAEGTGSVDDTVPIARIAAADDLLEAFIAADRIPNADRTHPVVARRRALVRRLAVMSPLWIIVAFIPWWAGVTLVVATIALAFAWSRLWYRALRHGADDSLLVTENGVLLWRRTVQPWVKVQSLSTSQSPMQRRVGLLDLRLDIAGSKTSTTVRDITRGRADQLIALASPSARLSIPAERAS